MTRAKRNINKRNIEPGAVLLVVGATANVTLWVGAFVSTEAQGAVSAWVRASLLPTLGGVSGLAMGATIAAGIVYVLGRLGKMQPTLQRKVRGKDEFRTTLNPRFWIAAVTGVLVLAISPALLGPYVYMTISGQDNLYAVLGGTWSAVWSVGRILAADLALAAIAAAHGANLGGRSAAQAAGSADAVREPAAQSAGKVRKSAGSLRAGAAQTAGKYACAVADCGYSTGSQPAFAAHMSHHRRKDRQAALAEELFSKAKEK